MSPLAFGKSASALGKCKRHGCALVPRPRADLLEQIATDRLADESRQWLEETGDPVTPPPVLTQPAVRRGDCPRCLEEIGAAAVAYLMNGETA